MNLIEVLEKLLKNIHANYYLNGKTVSESISEVLYPEYNEDEVRDFPFLEADECYIFGSKRTIVPFEVEEDEEFFSGEIIIETGKQLNTNRLNNLDHEVEFLFRVLPNNEEYFLDLISTSLCKEGIDAYITYSDKYVECFFYTKKDASRALELFNNLDVKKYTEKPKVWELSRKGIIQNKGNLMNGMFNTCLELTLNGYIESMINQDNDFLDPLKYIYFLKIFESNPKELYEYFEVEGYLEFVQLLESMYEAYSMKQEFNKLLNPSIDSIFKTVRQQTLFNNKDVTSEDVFELLYPSNKLKRKPHYVVSSSVNNKINCENGYFSTNVIDNKVFLENNELEVYLATNESFDITLLETLRNELKKHALRAFVNYYSYGVHIFLENKEDIIKVWDIIENNYLNKHLQELPIWESKIDKMGVYVNVSRTMYITYMSQILKDIANQTKGVIGEDGELFLLKEVKEYYNRSHILSKNFNDKTFRAVVDLMEHVINSEKLSKEGEKVLKNVINNKRAK